MLFIHISSHKNGFFYNFWCQFEVRTVVLQIYVVCTHSLKDADCRVMGLLGWEPAETYIITFTVKHNTTNNKLLFYSDQISKVLHVQCTFLHCIMYLSTVKYEPFQTEHEYPSYRKGLRIVNLWLLIKPYNTVIYLHLLSYIV